MLRVERARTNIVSVTFKNIQNTSKYLVVQGRVLLEHCSYIVRISVEATCWHLNPWYILKETTKLAGPFGTMPQKPWHPGKGAKPDCTMQLNCGEVCTHANYKKNRTWGNFNIRGTKMILLSDKLWLIANNSKSFANRRCIKEVYTYKVYVKTNAYV